MYNGKPIKLWGLNLCFSACAPEKPLAEKRIPALLEGQLQIDDTLTQGGDQKQLEGRQIPAAALAAVHSIVSAGGGKVPANPVLPGRVRLGSTRLRANPAVSS